MDKQLMAITKNSPRDEKGRVIGKPKPSAVATPATIQAAVGLMNESNSVTTSPAEVPDAADTPRRITALIPSGLYKKLAHFAVDHDQTVTDALVHILRDRL